MAAGTSHHIPAVKGDNEQWEQLGILPLGHPEMPGGKPVLPSKGAQNKIPVLPSGTGVENTWFALAVPSLFNSHQSTEKTQNWRILLSSSLPQLNTSEYCSVKQHQSQALLGEYKCSAARLLKQGTTHR